MRHTWADAHPLLTTYYENEWQIESHDDRYLFEMLVLEGMQAGLSWLTILKRREAMRSALDNFDYATIAEYDEDDFERLMNDEGMIRNRLKVRSIMSNAQAFMKIRAQYGTFDSYIWHFTDGKPVVSCFEDEAEIPTDNALSQQISKDLKKRGFKFVGPVIIYGYLGAIGIIQDKLK
ncbi:DNA-3-methyladenine glycosylase I [Macrococcoides canis]|uniref:DNA-3-methyladenine glycosylase I n=1 Tax=Macrococcoides canis TaxID=1855823 RepID=A0AAE6X0X0_9STAP|nr:DNA-3-methyladenine glycosylase I [Macrococcus canis]QCT74083.1 DNA-3-methyladenine glycosylase I [Macrococcus canis]QIH77510.1 DNA-3-methyladenine glycosylase I [Macrococcus canis]